MPEYSSTTITPADGVKTPAMNGSTSGNYTLSALRDFILASKGQANGLASLDANGKLPSSQLPDLADDVIVVASYATLPAIGTAGKIYITADNNKMFRWDPDLTTPDYVELSVDLSAYATKAELAEEESAREAADSNLLDAIDGMNARVENLEEKAGDYTEVQAKSVYSVPTGKASNVVLVGVEGVSRVNNQLINSSMRAGSISNGITPSFDYSTKTIALSGTSTGDFNAICIDAYNCLVVGHVYAVGFSKTPVGFTFSDAYNNISNIAGSYVYTASSLFFNLRGRGGTGVSPNYSSTISLTDLNTYFNTTDLSFLGATDSAKLAKIQSDYPWLLTPSSYGTSMVKTRYEGFKSYPFNLFDEVWETGNINNSTGADEPSSSIKRSVNYRECFGGKTYHLDGLNGNDTRIFFYDSSKVFISSISDTPSYPAPANACYFRLKTTNMSAESADVCINITSTLDGQYKPYRSPVTLSLPTPIELGSAGSVAEKAFLNEDGQAWKTNPINNNGVDLGTVHFTYAPVGTSGYFYSYSFDADMKRVATAQDKGNIICGGGYVLDTAYNVVYGSTSMVIGVNNSDSGKLILKNTAKTGADLDSQGKASWLNGVMFYYEKITPDADTPLTVLTDNLIQTEGGGTLEAVKTYPIDDSFTVGYLTL